MGFISPELESYCIQHSTQPSPLAKDLQKYTQAHVHGSNMLIGEMEGSLFAFLIKLSKARSILEFGTYTGYSALVMAEQLPHDGKLTTIDIDEKTTTLAKSFWAKSPHGHKIHSLLKPGLEAMRDLDQERFDLIFIDADKNNYSHYLEWSLSHLNEGGFIMVDNTLWSGKVLEEASDKQTTSIKEHNQKAAALEGHIKTLLPIRDGIFLIQKC